MIIHESIWRTDSKNINWNYKVKPIWEDFQKFYESNLSRILKHKDKGCMMISASRGNLSEEENKKRTDELAKDIRDYGLGFVRVLGGYVENLGEEDEREVTEESFFVPIVSTMDDTDFFDIAIELCKKYDQDSVLISLPDDTDCEEYEGFGYYNKNGEFEFSPGNSIKFSEEAVKQYFSMLVKGHNRNKKFSFTESNIQNNWFAVRKPSSVYQAVLIDKFNENIIYKK